MALGVVVGLLVAAIIDAARWILSRWPSILAAHKERKVLRKRRRATRTRDRAIEAELAQARRDGQIIAVKRTGYMPVEVTFSDETRSWYFSSDFDAYMDAMRSGRYPWGRTFAKPPPRIAGDPPVT